MAAKCGRGALRALVSQLNGCRAGAQESAPTESIRHPNCIQGPDGGAFLVAAIHLLAAGAKVHEY